MEKREVRIIAVQRKYKLQPYSSLPAWDERLGTYLTGQHIDIYDPSTKGNLTVEQMLNENKMTDEQRKKFGYVINPLIPINIRHLQVLDVSVDDDGNIMNHKDYWTYKYLLYQDFIAKSKGDVNPSKHFFYLEDNVYEAKSRISLRDRRYKAETLVRNNNSFDRLLEIGMLLNYYSNDFNVDLRNVNRTLLEDSIFELCDKDPDVVLKCFEEGWQERVFILKLVEKGIIQVKNMEFYDGVIFLGKDIDAVLSFLNKQENALLRNKWKALLDNSQAIDNRPTIEEVFTEGLKAIIDGDVDKLTYIYTLLEKEGRYDKISELKERYARTSFDKASHNVKISKSDEFEYKKLTNVTKKVKHKDLDLHKLRIKAGKLKLPREVWRKMNYEELKEYVESKEKELSLLDELGSPVDFNDSNDSNDSNA